MKVILDFDNTFFTENRDIDDGLALLYLLGSPEVEIVAITGTYGNSTMEVVDANTHRLLTLLGRQDIPYYSGGQKAGDYQSAASEQLVKWVQRYPGEIQLLATGSLTNLYGAQQQWPDFFQAVKRTVVMGGKTAPLLFKKQEMAELNFSCDPKASYQVLTQSHDLLIMTGNYCLDLPFTRAHYQSHFGQYQRHPIVQLIERYSDSWFTDNAETYGIDGFYNWDTLAACALVHPEFFEMEALETTLSMEQLQAGWLMPKTPDVSLGSLTLQLPVVAQPDALRTHIYQTWLNVTF
ncbi:MAG: nucleoside hydrolase [Aerococcus sp.]|nr:nucleoside hydrolase [Aerococcus sp.]